ncbi:unnamed protein product [Polarella glacialis]|uniref:Uncharacterized protein n=1 Tax=Polarella glacialis TaxID=89957 RepID=A0A813JDK5_POLGL|nr:unnamed protein product [Polarella glacialis]
MALHALCLSGCCRSRRLVFCWLALSVGPTLRCCSGGTAKKAQELRWRDVSPMEQRRSSQWTLAGFGHCPLRSTRFRRGAGNLRTPSLEACLGRCETLGPQRCRFASYLDADVILKAAARQGACLLSRRCSALRSTNPGAVTFVWRSSADGRMHRPRDSPGYRRSASDGASSVTLSLTGSSFSSASHWRPQLCAEGKPDAQEMRLATPCKSESAGLFHISLVNSRGSRINLATLTAQTNLTVFIATASGEMLCGDGGNLHLARSCELSRWEILRAGFRPFIDTTEVSTHWWLRLDGKFLAASPGGRVDLLHWDDANRLQRQRNWAVGYQQAWRQEHLPSDLPQVQDLGPPPPPGEPRTHLWLMASRSYQKAYELLKDSLQAAGESVRVFVRWAPDMKVIAEGGFQLNQDLPEGVHVACFNYRKYLLIFEALLVASLETRKKQPMVVVMDLDVQVFPGWTRNLRRCVFGDDSNNNNNNDSDSNNYKNNTNYNNDNSNINYNNNFNYNNHNKETARAADACFLQQPAFGVSRLQLANSGIEVFRGGSSGAGSLLHASVLRLQGMQLLIDLLPEVTWIEFEQLSLNMILHRIQQERTSRSMRWGVYSPMLAHVGMFVQSSLLTTTVHHATSSTANLADKLRILPAVRQLISDVREYCSEMDAHGALVAQAPMPGFCFLYNPEDPHFGPLLEHFRVYRDYDEEDNKEVMERLLNVLEGRYSWLQLLQQFNAGGWRNLKARRRNSSEYLEQILWKNVAF